MWYRERDAHASAACLLLPPRRAFAHGYASFSSTAGSTVVCAERRAVRPPVQVFRLPRSRAACCLCPRFAVRCSGAARENMMAVFPQTVSASRAARYAPFVFYKARFAFATAPSPRAYARREQFRCLPAACAAPPERARRRGGVLAGAPGGQKARCSHAMMPGPMLNAALSVHPAYNPQ